MTQTHFLRRPLLTLGLMLSAACAQTPSSSAPSSIDTVHTFLTALEREDRVVLGDLMTENVTVEVAYALPGTPARYEGRAAALGYFDTILRAYPERERVGTLEG